MEILAINTTRLTTMYKKYSQLRKEITACTYNERRNDKTSKTNFFYCLKLDRLVREMDLELTEILDATIIKK